MVDELLQNIRETAGEGGYLHSPTDVRMMHPLVLAYIGDTIYDLFVRTYLLHHFDCPVHQLHTKATTFVKAKAQSDTILKILDHLSEEEQYIFKRGRNAKSGTVPKNADVTDYRLATGFETLLGYLYLTGEDTRLIEIFKLTLETREEGK